MSLSLSLLADAYFALGNHNLSVYHNIWYCQRETINIFIKKNNVKRMSSDLDHLNDNIHVK